MPTTTCVLPKVDLVSSLRSLLGGLLDEQISIDTLAQMTGVKSRTLQRRLNDSGTSFTKLLDQVRFEVAAPLICDSDTPLTDIAYDLGFSDPAHFTRAFRRWTGMSPRDYRRAELMAQ